MTAFDLVVVLIIANAVQNAMVGTNASLTAGLVAAATLLVTNSVIDRLGLRYGWIRERLRGQPTLLVHEGVLIHEHLRHEGVAEDEVMQALREHGVEDLSTVKAAVLEVDGTISVISADVASSRTRRHLRGRRPAG